MKIRSINFTAALTKELKKSDRVFCSYDTETKIATVSNGVFAVRLNPAEYDDLVRPVTGRDPGDFTIDKTGCRPGAPDFSKALQRTGKEAAAQLAPFTFPDENGKCTLNAYYSPEAGAAFVNAAFVAMLARPVMAYTAGPVSPLFFLNGNGDILALLLPIRLTKVSRLSAAVTAYFDDSDAGEKAARLEAEKAAALARAGIAEQNRDYYKTELEKALARIEELETAAAGYAADLKEAEERAKEAEDIICHDVQKEIDKENAITEKTAAFEKLDGVTVVIKGASTNKPVAWITGETKKHADTLKKAGCKWSAKRAAWYLTA